MELSPSIQVTLGALPSELSPPSVDRTLSTNSSLYIMWTAPILD